MSQRAALDHEAHENRLQLADVARQYYVEDFTQEQIARRIGVSRSHVSRMLKEARALGIVEINVHHPLRTRPDFQERLQEMLPLAQSLVLAASPEPNGEQPEAAHNTVIARQLGALAARFLNERIAEN
nr:helix-turn-helix domain-containing protein [Chloroflexia bacterium]